MSQKPSDFLDASKIADIIKKREESANQKEILVENEKEYRLAVNRVYSTNEGKLLAKIMLRHNGMFKDENQLNPAGLIEEKGKRSYYLRYVRPYLENKLRMQIENI